MPNGEIYHGNLVLESWSEENAFFSKSDYQSYYEKDTMVDGIQCGRIKAVGPNGLTFQAEYLPSFTFLHGYGLAKDNHGNIYKFKF